MPSIPNLTEPLTDSVVSLRLGAEWDIPDILIAYQDDPEMHLRLGEDRPPTGAELGSASERHEADRLAGECARLTMVQPGSDDCRGRITVHHIDWYNRKAELGIWVAPQVRGSGVARSALRLAAVWLFDDLGLERLTLITETHNEPMLRAGRAAGFVEEGVLRGYDRTPTGRVDCTIMSLIPTDLEA